MKCLKEFQHVLSGFFQTYCKLLQVEKRANFFEGGSPEFPLNNFLLVVLLFLFVYFLVPNSQPHKSLATATRVPCDESLGVDRG